jgi:hypothetical protein
MLTIHAPSRKPCVIITEIHHYITTIYLRLLQRPRLERLETLDVFSEFLFVIGIHIQISTIIPTRMPITIPAIDPLSRVELLAVVAVDEMDVVVATLRSDQTYMNHSKIREESHTCYGCSNSCRRRCLHNRRRRRCHRGGGRSTALSWVETCLARITARVPAGCLPLVTVTDQSASGGRCKPCRCCGCGIVDCRGALCIVILICVTGISGRTTELAAIAAVSRAGGTLGEVGVFWFGFERDGTRADYAGTEMKEEEQWQLY